MKAYPPLESDSMDWNQLADRVLDGKSVSRSEALALASSGESELRAVLGAALRIRHHHHGMKVRLHVLRNAKSGICPEDCSFCSQSLKFQTDVPRYPMQGADELVDGARDAYGMGAVTYCIVTATRGPTTGELDIVCEAAHRIKEEFPLKLCASLGLLSQEQADRLAAAGIDRYNHNLESSRGHFPEVCTTHTWEDRVETIQRAKAAGMEACCGGIMGMGESLEDRVDLALSLRSLRVESVPVNLLNARPGTPLEHVSPLSSTEALAALAMFRFVHPEVDLRIAGGREVVLGDAQHLALYAANSMFTDGYLTTPGQGESADHRMIRSAGFHPEVAGSIGAHEVEAGLP